MRLEINEDKTRIYDLTKDKMKYLGYIFYAFKRHSKNPQQNGKYFVTNSLPEAKADEITEKCRSLLNSIKKHHDLESIHNWNVYVVGVHNYYRGMAHFCENFQRINWRIRKQFYHTMKSNVKFTTVQSYKDDFQSGRYSSWGKKGYFCYGTIPVIEIGWANWDKKLIASTKGKVNRKNPYSYGAKKHKPGVSLEEIGYLVNTSRYIKNSRYAMFRISKYSAMKGISYLSGQAVPVDEYHCHHIIPRDRRGSNDFNNLCVLSEAEHRTLHSKSPDMLYELFPKRKRRIKALIEALQEKIA